MKQILFVLDEAGQVLAVSGAVTVPEFLNIAASAAQFAFAGSLENNCTCPACQTVAGDAKALRDFVVALCKAGANAPPREVRVREEKTTPGREKPHAH